MDPSFSRRLPPGDSHERRVCDHCGFVDYENPRIVTGAVCSWEERILLCRRAIEPRAGWWTLPAGFLECGESAEEGAAREAREEAGAEIEVGALLGAFSVPHISQVHLFFAARLRAPDLHAGLESSEARLFAWDQIPWDDLAFPSVRWALLAHRELAGRPGAGPRAGIADLRGRR
jgi:ADP-ribose pyrophosphatase YjhB (NUDIX family)